MPVTLSDISSSDKYSFLCEWFDVESSILRKFFMFYFPSDGTIEMYDRQRKRCFLKRTMVEEVELSDIYIGNTVKIFNRQIKITDYANIYTKKIMGETMQKTFALLKADGVKQKSKIIKAILCAGFKISNLRMMKLTQEMVYDIFPGDRGSSEFLSLLTFLTSGPVIAMELIRANAVEKFLEFAGPEDPSEARKSVPESLRGLYGADIIHNVVFTVPTIEKGQQFIEYFFGRSAPESSSETSTVVLKNSTCCVIKPHAIRNGYLGDIMTLIEEEGYTITAVQMYYIDYVNAEEFFEVYKGVVHEYSEMVNELISGGCVAMEITGPMEDETPMHFRNFVGPADPDMARQLRPSTLRALYGENRIKNGLHVTDLPEDAILEVEYFFKILV